MEDKEDKTGQVYKLQGFDQSIDTKEEETEKLLCLPLLFPINKVVGCVTGQ